MAPNSDSALSRLGKVVACLLAGSLFAGACGGSSPPSESDPLAVAAEPSLSDPSSTVLSAAPVPIAAKTVTLVAVGDLMLGRSIGSELLAGEGEPVFDEALASLLSSAGITVGNFESSMSERGEPRSKGYTFRAPPAAVGPLVAAGFDVVSLANNHALDYGPLALADTEAYLRAAGIQPAGSGPDLAAAGASVVVERDGLRIAFVALVDAPPEGAGFSRESWEAREDRAGVAWADLETVTSAVARAARSADLVVVLLHFGDEFQTSPSASQRSLAHAAIDAGAVAVIGSHPHVLQEVEAYGGGVIAYSLGNFVFDGFEGLVDESAVLRITLTRDGVSGWELLPVRIDPGGRPHLREPRGARRSRRPGRAGRGAALNTARARRLQWTRPR